MNNEQLKITDSLIKNNPNDQTFISTFKFIPKDKLLFPEKSFYSHVDVNWALGQSSQ